MRLRRRSPPAGHDLPLTFREIRGQIYVVTTEEVDFGDFVVPAGFVSDGASIPWWGWTVIGHPFDHKYLMEAVGHDYLYRFQKWSRWKSDLWFLRRLKKPWLWVRRWIIWGALRAAGWIAWRQNKKRKGRLE